MSLSITIAGEEKVKSVEFGSLVIDNIKNEKIDTCKFNIKSYTGNRYTPQRGREVVVTHNGSKVFGGQIVSTETTQLSNDMVRHKIECTDYTRLLGAKLVPDTYKNKTANYIISDLVTKYAPAGFTTNNVDADVEIKYAGFNYLTVEKCIQSIADLLNYDWYVDYDKDIHFFARASVDAPIDITDNGGVYTKNSLIIRRDNSQVRNSIVVRGGEYLGTQFSFDIECDGEKSVYNLPYKYSDFSATLTGQSLNVGIEPLQDEIADQFDAMHNFNEKTLRWREVRKPTAGSILRVGGKPHLPVIVEEKSQSHIDAMVSMEGGSGEYQHLIIDKTLDTKEGARQRADAEISAYAQTLSEGEFETETDGLKAGQRILINSTSLGINEYFYINRVRIRQLTTTSLYYEISLITSKTNDLITVLQKMLLDQNKKLVIDENEIINLIENADEEMTIGESYTFGDHNQQNEEMTVGESTTAQSIDYDVIFVTGPYIWGGEGSGDNKRTFLTNGSRLG